MATVRNPGWCPQTPVMESTHVTKENCEDPRIRVGDNLSVEKITGRVGQTAARMYLVPSGSERMSAYWTNYIRLADAYVCGQEDRFLYVSFRTQQSYNELDIARECSATEELMNMYRQFYNEAITQFRRTHDSSDLECALEYLVDFNKEHNELNSAAKVLQSWVRNTVIRPKCSCGDRSMFDDGGLCVDCHWTEDSRMKKANRR